MAQSIDPSVPPSRDARPMITFERMIRSEYSWQLVLSCELFDWIETRPEHYFEGSRGDVVVCDHTESFYVDDVEIHLGPGFRGTTTTVTSHHLSYDQFSRIKQLMEEAIATIQSENKYEGVTWLGSGPSPGGRLLNRELSFGYKYLSRHEQPTIKLAIPTEVHNVLSDKKFTSSTGLQISSHRGSITCTKDESSIYINFPGYPLILPSTTSRWHELDQHFAELQLAFAELSRFAMNREKRGKCSIL